MSRGFDLMPETLVSFDLEIQEFPPWVSVRTAEYVNGNIRASIEEEASDKGFLGNDDLKIAVHCIHDPALKKIWEKMQKIYPSSPCRGQILLFGDICQSIQPDFLNYATYSEAKAWREEFLATAQSLISLWKSRPHNVAARFHLRKGYYWLTEKEKNKPFNIDTDIFLDGHFQEGAFLSLYYGAVKKAGYAPGYHSKQVRGMKAERIHFVRSLSGRMKSMTGQWKREMVAIITSSVFQCDFSAQDVVRSTRGWQEESYDGFYKMSDEDWNRAMGWEAKTP
jgi:hypothetical protein